MAAGLYPPAINRARRLRDAGRAHAARRRALRAACPPACFVACLCLLARAYGTRRRVIAVGIATALLAFVIVTLASAGAMEGVRHWLFG
jgi:hypothetical protein